MFGSHKTSFVVLSFAFIVQLESFGKWTHFHALAVFSTFSQPLFLFLEPRHPSLILDSRLSSLDTRLETR